MSAEVRGFGGWTSSGVILVLFILLVIVACACWI
ncbi:dihydroorotate dehydrogenase [Paenibacillus senegalensis]|nr:dihydroorotate dehydrogenase [Paenibacillus senegalensis]